MCELAAQQPRDALTPYERRALAHVAFRAGAHHEVPAPALSDGFGDGEDTFLEGFRRDVAADARERGLSQPRLRGRIRALLCAAALVPAAAAAAAVVAADHRAGLWYVLLGFGAACAVVIAVGAREVPSRAGRAALAAHRPARAVKGGLASGETGRAPA
jgi:transposase InsO family protein